MTSPHSQDTSAGIEIERAFLVSLENAQARISDLDGIAIQQGYIAQQGDTEVRVREKKGTCYLTVKKGKGAVRIEEEIILEKGDFERLWKLTENARLVKTRYVIPHGDLHIELDVYHEQLEGFCRAEVEFTNEASCDHFEAPDWFGKEITEDTRYANRSLARHGVPTT